MRQNKKAAMDKPDVLDLKVDQLAELRSFEEGYRGAWFRCKIKDFKWSKDVVLMEYYDFPDEGFTWEKLYQVQVHPYGRKSKNSKKELMLRPKYPPMYDKSQMPPIDTISEVSIILERPWKVGDLVDWFKDDCYWSGRIVEILDEDRVEIEFPPAPSGEGGSSEAFSMDLRPSLKWSSKEGWTLPTVEGQNSCSARLIFPAKQGAANQPDVNAETRAVHAAGASSLHASSSSHVSAISLLVPSGPNAKGPVSEQPPPVNGIHSVDLPQSREVNMDVDVVGSLNGKASSSDSVATSLVQETKQREEIDCFNATIPLNSMLDDTLEAPIMDLEELANKIKWMKSILQGHQSSSGSTSSWKFVEQRT